MTRWLHPPELERDRERDRLDPVVEGARHGLTRELSVAIWERVCADATDGFGRRDTEQAQQRFHEIAARIAARGGRLRPDVGRLTRVGTELDGTPRGTWSADELTPRTPGRETLVAAETRRWAARSAEPAAVLEETEAADGSERDGGATERHELPHAGEVAQALASLLRPSSDQAKALDVSEHAAARRRLDVELAAGSPPEREIEREPRDGQLPTATLERMEQAYSQRFDDVEIHTDSAEVPAGQQAFARGRHIYFERGAFEPESEHGEHVIAHELAHVAQQSQPANSGRPATRVALEADAHQAALAALTGRTAMVNLFAPPSAALGFSNDKPPQHPAAAHGSAGRPPVQRARGSTPASSSGATHAPGVTRAPTSAGSGGTSARSGATPVARPAASYAAASAPPATAPHRGANADGLLIPEAPGALSPAAAGRLQTIRTDNQGVAAATTTLPSGEQQTDVARGAVVEPQAEQDAYAQHGVVASVDDRPPPSPEIEAACARIRQVIRDKRPPDEDKLVDAKPREMAQEAGNQMSAGVEQRAGTVRQGYADMQNSPQGTPSRTPVPATLPPERVSTPPVDAAAGAPDPLHHDDVSLDNDVAAQKQRIQDAGMNTEPAKLVKDGPIGDAHGGADDLQNMAKTDPHKVLADQAAAVAHAQSDMRALQATAEKILAGARSGTVAHIATHTTGVKGSEEQQRATAGAQMQAIFTRTQKSVDTLLQPLSKNAVARWEAGVTQLSTDFETSLADVKKKIEDRHSGVLGGLTELGDDVFGLPSWVTLDYDIAEAKFADGATSLITDISRDVNQVIEDCKKLIEQARKDIEAVVHSLPASLQSWAQGEAAKLGQKLDQLSQHVDQTQHVLNQDLINRANGAVQQVREQVADLREKAKGVIGKIADAITEFVKNPAKAIINGLLHVLGIPPASFWSLIDRLGDVVGAIAKDPVKFGNTLVSGSGQGFKLFFEHFPQHIGQSIMSWIFGTLGAVGVQMPTDFSGPGIMGAVLGMMGIDGGLVTSMLGSDLADPDERAEAHQEVASVLSGGPMAMVGFLRDHFDPASLIPMIKEAALSFLLQAVITRVAIRIAMMFNPAGAILQAIEAIFRILMWVVNNAARIFTLIETLVGAAAQMAAGNVGAVAAAVESALAQIIVPVIDFLAGYLGLGGLPGKIREVIMKLRGKIDAALKKVLGAISRRAKARTWAKKHGKPGKDQPAAGKPREDENDPRRPKDHPDENDPRAKQRDDDKDPRNHKHDDDDRDPRNHKHGDDDRDPRDHKHGDDDRDPRNHKHGDRHDPRKRKDRDDNDPKTHKDRNDRDPKKPDDDDHDGDDAAQKPLKKIGEVIHVHAVDDGHRIWIAVNGRTATTMVAPEPMPVSGQLAKMRAHRGALPDDKQATASRLLQQAEAELRRTDQEAEQALRTNTQASNQQVITQERELANTLKCLFDTYTISDEPLLQRSLQMHTHGHTLFASVHGGKLLVELASRRAILYKLILDAMDRENAGAKRSALLEKLDELKALLLTLEGAVLANERRYDQGGMPPEQIAEQTDQVAVMLVALGSVFKIDDLEHLGHPSIYVEGDKLKQEYRGTALRTTFYGSFRASVTEHWKPPELRRLKAEALARGGGRSEFWCVGVPGKTEPHCMPVAVAEIDHKFELAAHWNAVGHNQTQPERDAWHNNTNNLQLLCKGCNLAKGGPSTEPTVGPNFRGKLDG